MNAFMFLQQLRPAIPFSVEHPCKEMSGGELKRHIQQGAVLFNGEKVSVTEEVNFPIFSLVFFPKSAFRRTTLI